jgi:hypothetical protein
MGLQDLDPMEIMWGKSSKVPSVTKKEKIYTLTPIGKNKADNIDNSEQDFELLSTMQLRKAWNIKDLSHELDMPTNEVSHGVQRNIGRGFIKTVGDNGS